MACNLTLNSDIFLRGSHLFKWANGVLYRLDPVLKPGRKKRTKCWCEAKSFQKWLTPDPCNADDVERNPKILEDAIKLHQHMTGAFYH